MNSIQGQIDSDLPDTSDFPIPGKMTVSAGCTEVTTNFSDAKKEANKGLDYAKEKRASVGYGGYLFSDYTGSIQGVIDQYKAVGY